MVEPMLRRLQEFNQQRRMDHQELTCTIINNFVVVFMTFPQIFPVFYSDRSVLSALTVPENFQHTTLFCSLQLQYSLLSQKFTITKIQIAMSLKMAGVFFVCLYSICLAKVLTKFHCPSTNTFCLASF